MRDSVTFTRTQDKRASLAAHYGLFRQLFKDQFKGSNFVPGEGNIDSEIVFVGEAPGYHENEKRKPFVGKSGEYLESLLELAEIKRGDVFITNFMKYQPPGNRDPKGDEVPVCMHLLRKELEILAPKIVVTLGRFSTSLFFEQPHMGTLAGTMWPNRRGFIVLPMYHPAAAMYDTSGDIDAAMRHHIKLVGEVFHGAAKLPLTKRPKLTKVSKVVLTK